MHTHTNANKRKQTLHKMHTHTIIYLVLMVRKQHSKLWWQNNWRRKGVYKWVSDRKLANSSKFSSHTNCILLIKIKWIISRHCCDGFILLRTHFTTSNEKQNNFSTFPRFCIECWLSFAYIRSHCAHCQTLHTEIARTNIFCILNIYNKKKILCVGVSVLPGDFHIDWWYFINANSMNVVSPGSVSERERDMRKLEKSKRIQRQRYGGKATITIQTTQHPL